MTVDELPKHNHAYPHLQNGATTSGYSTGWGNTPYAMATTSYAGGDGSHNNVQPYKTVYVFVRTK